jgi:rhamnose transport system substrate-binding protein
VLSMGRVGNLTLDDNNEGAMANPFVFDKTNIADYAKIY